jgi:hypothetical protein
MDVIKQIECTETQLLCTLFKFQGTYYVRYPGGSCHKAKYVQQDPKKWRWYEHVGTWTGDTIQFLEEYKPEKDNDADYESSDQEGVFAPLQQASRRLMRAEKEVRMNPGDESAVERLRDAIKNHTLHVEVFSNY